MATTSKRSVIINYSGDLTLAHEFRAADNLNSNGFTSGFQVLQAGDNPLGFLQNYSRAVTIIPKAGNTTAIRIKGAPGDTGIRIHNTDPTSVALDSTVTPVLIINVAAVCEVTLLIN